MNPAIRVTDRFPRAAGVSAKASPEDGQPADQRYVMFSPYPG
jgi:hypothetical protein